MIPITSELLVIISEVNIITVYARFINDILAILSLLNADAYHFLHYPYVEIAIFKIKRIVITCVFIDIIRLMVAVRVVKFFLLSIF